MMFQGRENDLGDKDISADGAVGSFCQPRCFAGRRYSRIDDGPVPEGGVFIISGVFSAGRTIPDMIPAGFGASDFGGGELHHIVMLEGVIDIVGG